MKKLTLTLAVILGITFSVSAQNRGLFDRGPQRESYDCYDNYGTRDGMFNLPSSHGQTNDESAPLGGGALLLIGFGAAYAMKKRRKK